MNAMIETINSAGVAWIDFARAMGWQVSVVVGVLWLLDRVLRRHARAAVRYGAGLLVLLKLVLPPSLALPTGPGYWLRPVMTAPRTVSTQVQTLSHKSNEVQIAASEVPQPLRKPAITLSGAGMLLLVVMGVTLALLVYLFRRWREMRRLVQAAGPAPDHLNELLERELQRLRLHRAVSMRVTEQVMSPALCGWWKPVILIPRRLLEALPEEQMQSVLLHEAMHLKRGDVWVNTVQTLLQIAYWWHPLVWAANAKLRRLREEAVDEGVVVAMNGESDRYAATLLAVARQCLVRPMTAIGLVGIIESQTVLKQRIDRLIHLPPPRHARVGLVGCLFVVMLGMVLLPLAQGRPQLLGKADVQQRRVKGYDEIQFDVLFYEVTESELAQLQLPQPKVSHGYQVWPLDQKHMAMLVTQAKKMPCFDRLEQWDLAGKYSGIPYNYYLGSTHSSGVNFYSEDTSHGVRVSRTDIHPMTLVNLDDANAVTNYAVVKIRRAQRFTAVARREKDDLVLETDWEIDRQSHLFQQPVRFDHDGGAVVSSPKDAVTGKQLVVLLLGQRVYRDRRGNLLMTGKAKEIEWQPWSPAAVEKARLDGKVVLVNFAADWDVTGQKNQRQALETPVMIAMFNNIDAVAFKADMTREHALAEAELKKYHRTGVPLTLVYPRDLRSGPIVLPELLTQEKIVDALTNAATFAPKIYFEASLYSVPIAQFDKLGLLPEQFKAGVAGGFWKLDRSQKQGIFDRLQKMKWEALSRPRMDTGNHIGGKLFVGDTVSFLDASGKTSHVDCGFTFEVNPKIARDWNAMDLNVSATWTQQAGYRDAEKRQPVFNTQSTTNTTMLSTNQFLIMVTKAPAQIQQKSTSTSATNENVMLVVMTHKVAEAK